MYKEIINNLSNRDEIINCKVKIDDLEGTIFYIPDMADIKKFNDYYLQKINNQNYQTLDTVIPGIVQKIKLYTTNHFNVLLASGNLILIINDISYSFNLRSTAKRSIGKSEFDPINLFESGDGFTESASDNIALVKQRIKSESLNVVKFELGDLSSNITFVVCLKDTMKEDYYKSIIETLSSSSLTSSNSINDINNLFQKDALVPLVHNTGSPNTFIDCILKGKVGIIVDNCPVTAILPGTMLLFTSNKAEVNAPKYFTIFNRLFIWTFYFISIFSLGLFTAIVNFHPNDLLLTLISNIQLSDKGTSFSMILEILIVLFLFEFYRLTVSRSPNNFVQNIVIIFGGVFIGQNAISSGLVGSLALMLASLSYIAGFGLTNNPHFITSINIFRLFIIILSYGMGLIGFIVSSLIVTSYLFNLDSTKVPYMEPFTPAVFRRIKDFFIPKNHMREIS